MSFPRHIPERTCIACRRKRPQQDLLRLTSTARGWALLDGPRSGRGAYVCSDSPACWSEKRLRRLGASAASLSEQLRSRAILTEFSQDGGPRERTDMRSSS